MFDSLQLNRFSKTTSIKDVLGIDNFQSRILEKGGFPFLESFYKMEKTEIVSILNKLLKLHIQFCNEFGNKICESLANLSILQDTSFVPENVYSVNTRRRIINLGFTSWKDLSLYVLQLGSAERSYFINKFIKLISKQQQSSFLNRLYNIFYKDIFYNKNNPFLVDWTAVSFLPEVFRNKLIERGFLSPFFIIEKFKDFNSAIEGINPREFMPAGMFKHLCSVASYIWSNKNQVDNLFMSSDIISFKPYTEYFNILQLPDPWSGLEIKPEGTVGMHLNKLVSQTRIPNYQFNFGTNLPFHLPIQGITAYTAWVNPILEIYNLVAAAASFENIQYVNSLKFGTNLIIREARSQKSRIRAKSKLFYSSQIIKEFWNGNANLNSYLNMTPQNMWNIAIAPPVPKEDYYFYTANIPVTDILSFQYFESDILNTIKPLAFRDYSEFMQLTEVCCRLVSTVRIPNVVFQRIFERTNFFMEHLSFFSIGNRLKHTFYSNEDHQKAAPIKKPFYYQPGDVQQMQTLSELNAVFLNTP